MTGIIASVECRLRRSAKNAECIVKRCKKGNCSVSLAGTPRRRLIVDLDKPGSPLGQADKRCDYLVFAEPPDGDLWIAPVELKKGSVRSSEVIEQLQAGASVAAGLVSAHVAAGVRFRPVLASGAIHKDDRRKLRAKPIKFHKQRELVRRIKCGARLIGVFDR